MRKRRNPSTIEQCSRRQLIRRIREIKNRAENEIPVETFHGLNDLLEYITEPIYYYNYEKIENATWVDERVKKRRRGHSKRKDNRESSDKEESDSRPADRVQQQRMREAIHG